MLFLNRKYFRYLLILAVSAGTGSTAQPMEYNLLGEQFTLQLSNDSVWAVNYDKGYTFKTSMVLYTDFNADGLQDIITSDTSSCGNWGDCIYMFFLQQPDASYKCLFSDYLYYFEELHTVPGKEEWLKFNVYQRAEAVLVEDVEEYTLKHAGVLEYNGAIYVVKPL